MALVQKTLKEIKSYLDSLGEKEQIEYLEKISNDQRKTVKELVRKYQSVLIKKSAERQRLLKLWEMEHNLFRQGYKCIAGVDEAGRGPLAGPVVAGAVVLPPYCIIEGLKDSKKIPEKKRGLIAEEIKRKAVYWSVGVVDCRTIDKINILEATRYAMYLAVLSLGGNPEYILIDGGNNPLIETPHSGIVKGDSLSASIAAASVIAKTHRDKLMGVYEHLYPGYHFSINKGYGTEQHLLALEKLGPSPIHRMTFAPLNTNAAMYQCNLK